MRIGLLLSRTRTQPNAQSGYSAYRYIVGWLHSLFRSLHHKDFWGFFLLRASLPLSFGTAWPLMQASYMGKSIMMPKMGWLKRISKQYKFIDDWTVRRNSNNKSMDSARVEASRFKIIQIVCVCRSEMVGWPLHFRPSFDVILHIGRIHGSPCRR